MRLADNELEVFHELLEQMENEPVQELASLIKAMQSAPVAAKPGDYTQQAKAGEQLLLDKLRQQNWGYVGREPTQPVTTPGPDAVAWKRRPDGQLELWLIDNKARKDAVVRAVDALMPRSLIRNIAPTIHHMRNLGIDRKHKDGVAAQALLWKSLHALVHGQGLPAGVCRVVTNGSGKSRSIHFNLFLRGVRFRDVNRPFTFCGTTSKGETPSGAKELAELLGLERVAAP
jgi:hypothetical protein